MSWRLVRAYGCQYHDPAKVAFWLAELEKFRAAGGVTAEQWDTWLDDDDPHKADPVPARGYLRLVVENRKTEKTVGKTSVRIGGGDEAA